jgi:hypothetical protein
MTDFIAPTGNFQGAAAPIGASTSCWGYPNSGDYSYLLPPLYSTTVAVTVQNPSSSFSMTVWPSNPDLIAGLGLGVYGQTISPQSSHTFTPGNPAGPVTQWVVS